MCLVSAVTACFALLLDENEEKKNENVGWVVQEEGRKERGGMGWDGMGWDGMGWDGMG